MEAKSKDKRQEQDQDYLAGGKTGVRMRREGTGKGTLSSHGSVKRGSLSFCWIPPLPPLFFPFIKCFGISPNNWECTREMMAAWCWVGKRYMVKNKGAHFLPPPAHVSNFTILRWGDYPGFSKLARASQSNLNTCKGMAGS